jgi:hypothetical protein
MGHQKAESTPDASASSSAARFNQNTTTQPQTPQYRTAQLYPLELEIDQEAPCKGINLNLLQRRHITDTSLMRA